MDSILLVNVLVRVFLVTALPLVLALSCGGDDKPALPSATPIVVESYRERLDPTVWQRVEAASWYDGGHVTPDGHRLLDIMTTGGPLWRSANSIALLEAFPDGLDDETLSAAEQYARLRLLTLHEVILSPWIVDGVDDYERAVLAAVRERTVSHQALRRALDEGFFREAFEADRNSLSAVEIDALGSLQPRMLELLHEQGWFAEGISEYEASLLGVLNSLLTVEEQLEILEGGNHLPVALASRDIAVVYLGNEPELQARAHAIIVEWMPKVEEFSGDFRPIGLVVDITRIPTAGACHAGGNVNFRPGRIALPLDFCFLPGVLIHELAHVFIGGRYPAWFAEGVAEVVSYHLTGSRSGYSNGFGRIELEGNHPVSTQSYYNQSALGADFLEDLYDLAGVEEMSAFIKDVAARNLSGQNLLERIRRMEVNRSELEALIRDAFGPDVALR